MKSKEEFITYTTNLTPIEIALGIDENGMTTARKLYGFLELAKGQFARWAKANIIENEFAEENVDYWGVDINVEGNVTQDYKLTAHFAKKLSVKGNGERAEQAREYFTRLEEKVKQKAVNLASLSPQLQMFNAIFQSVAQTELEQKRQASQISKLQENQALISQAVTKESEKNFREWVNSCLSRIAESDNFQYIGTREERHKAVRIESYKRLNEKRPCRLDQRVLTGKGKAAKAGASTARINAINKLTIIEADKDLKPVYESVIREMLIAYCVDVM